MKFRLFSFLSDGLSKSNTRAFLNLPVLCMLCFLLVCCRPPAARGQEAAPEPRAAEASAAASCIPVNDCKPPFSAMKFYIVIDGRLETRTLSRRELAAASFETDGYISGIVAVGGKGIDARVNGRPMPAAEPKADGTFSFGYYGKLKPEQLLLAGVSEENDGIKTPEPPGKPFFGADVYSCFPTVPADTISKDSRFFIALDTGAATWRMQVRQSGGQKITESGVTGSGPGSVPFRYVGVQQNAMGESDRELYLRMEAISNGIRKVEAAFHTGLVGTVNVLNFEEIHNAVTCMNQNDIWFYINTFENEPIDELNVIAEHEALHILVDRLGLTGNRVVRKMFADLKGFDDLSIERFRLVTQGQTGSRSRLEKGEQGYFFDFISERNYLNGMKGGHPQEDLDEFCTSFLHTLMYMDRFEENLSKAEGLGMQERAIVVANYIQLLEIVRQQLNNAGIAPVDGTDSVSGVRFVSEQLAMIKGLDQRVQASNGGLPSE